MIRFALVQQKERTFRWNMRLSLSLVYSSTSSAPSPVAILHLTLVVNCISSHSGLQVIEDRSQKKLIKVLEFID